MAPRKRPPTAAAPVLMLAILAFCLAVVMPQPGAAQLFESTSCRQLPGYTASIHADITGSTIQIYNTQTDALAACDADDRCKSFNSKGEIKSTSRNANVSLNICLYVKTRLQVESSCTLSDRTSQGFFSIIRGADHPGDDLEFVGGLMTNAVNQAAGRCPLDEGCDGFNRVGWLKGSSAPLPISRAECFFIRKNTVCKTYKGYLTLSDRDHPWSPADTYSFGKEAAAASNCSVLSKCTGFNSGGEAKSNEFNLEWVPGSCFYQKLHASTACASVRGYQVMQNAAIDPALVVVGSTMWPNVSMAIAACESDPKCKSFNREGSQGQTNIWAQTIFPGAPGACLYLKVTTDCPTFDGYDTAPDLDHAGDVIDRLDAGNVTLNTTTDNSYRIACDKNPDCGGFTLDRWRTTGYTHYTRKAMLPLDYRRGACSYVKWKPQECWPVPGFTSYTDSDVSGAKMATYTSFNSLYDAADACNKNSNCKAFNSKDGVTITKSQATMTFTRDVCLYVPVPAQCPRIDGYTVMSDTTWTVASRTVNMVEDANNACNTNSSCQGFGFIWTDSSPGAASSITITTSTKTGYRKRGCFYMKMKTNCTVIDGYNASVDMDSMGPVMVVYNDSTSAQANCYFDQNCTGFSSSLWKTKANGTLSYSYGTCWYTKKACPPQAGYNASFYGTSGGVSTSSYSTAALARAACEASATCVGFGSDNVTRSSKSPLKNTRFGCFYEKTPTTCTALVGYTTMPDYTGNGTTITTVPKLDTANFLCNTNTACLAFSSLGNATSSTLSSNKTAYSHGYCLYVKQATVCPSVTGFNASVDQDSSGVPTSTYNDIQAAAMDCWYGVCHGFTLAVTTSTAKTRKAGKLSTSFGSCYYTKARQTVCDGAPAGYTVFTDVDVLGNTSMSFTSLAGALAACSVDANCKGYNSGGLTKSSTSIINSTLTFGACFYQKIDTVCLTIDGYDTFMDVAAQGATLASYFDLQLFTAPLMCNRDGNCTGFTSTGDLKSSNVTTPFHGLCFYKKKETVCPDQPGYTTLVDIYTQTKTVAVYNNSAVARAACNADSACKGFTSLADSSSTKMIIAPLSLHGACTYQKSPKDCQRLPGYTTYADNNMQGSVLKAYPDQASAQAACYWDSACLGFSDSDWATKASGKLSYSYGVCWYSKNYTDYCVKPSPSVSCTNTVGGFTEVCRAGYEKYNSVTRVCSDVNECLTADSSVNCTNLPGSFNEVCKPGFGQYNASSRTCSGACPFIALPGGDYTFSCEGCSFNQGTCQLSCSFCNSSLTTQRLDLINCYSDRGVAYSEETTSLFCIPPDPCATPDASVICTTTDVYTASFMEGCKAGYQNYNNSTRKCTDINECANADSSVACINTNGNYSEGCKPGYQTYNVTTRKCSDINECANADNSVTCTNTNGNYSEGCKPGYQKYNATTRNCSDINECLTADPSVNCTNTVGGFIEVCWMAGYSYDNVTRKCSDINECLTADTSVDCTNILGGFTEVCKTGFQNYDSVTRKCSNAESKLGSYLLPKALIPDVLYLDAMVGVTLSDTDALSNVNTWVDVYPQLRPEVSMSFSGTCKLDSAGTPSAAIVFDHTTCYGRIPHNLSAWNSSATSPFTLVWVGQVQNWTTQDQVMFAMGRSSDEHSNQLYWSNRVVEKADQPRDWSDYSPNYFTLLPFAKGDYNQWIIDVLIRQQGGGKLVRYRYSTQNSILTSDSTDCKSWRIETDNLVVGLDMEYQSNRLGGKLSALLMYNRALTSGDVMGLAASYSSRFLSLDMCAGADASVDCINTATGYTEACKTGYQNYNSATRQCSDIDECSSMVATSVTCNNTAGGFTETCKNGYYNYNSTTRSCSHAVPCPYTSYPDGSWSQSCSCYDVLLWSSCQLGCSCSLSIDGFYYGSLWTTLDLSTCAPQQWRYIRNINGVLTCVSDYCATADASVTCTNTASGYTEVCKTRTWIYYNTTRKCVQNDCAYADPSVNCTLFETGGYTEVCRNSSWVYLNTSRKCVQDYCTAADSSVICTLNANGFTEVCRDKTLLYFDTRRKCVTNNCAGADSSVICTPSVTSYTEVCKNSSLIYFNTIRKCVPNNCDGADSSVICTPSITGYTEVCKNSSWIYFNTTRKCVQDYCAVADSSVTCTLTAGGFTEVCKNSSWVYTNTTRKCAPCPFSATPNASYSATCLGCNLKATCWLVCDSGCRNRRGDWVPADLNLLTCGSTYRIGNNDGALFCVP